MAQDNEPDISVESSVRLSKDGADLLRQALAGRPQFQLDVIESAGAEGGGGSVDVLFGLAKNGVTFLAGVLSVILIRHEISITIGQTTIKGTALKREDLEVLLERTLEVERKRLAITNPPSDKT